MSMEQWWNDTDRGNWSAGRKTLYSVGSRWMDEYGAMVERYWQGKLKCWEKNIIQHSFIHSIGMCGMRRFLAVLRGFFYSSLLYTLFFHPFPPTSIPSSLTLSCQQFLGLPLSLVVPKFIYKILFWEFYFLPFSVHAQTNVIYLTLLSLL